MFDVGRFHTVFCPGYRSGERVSICRYVKDNSVKFVLYSDLYTYIFCLPSGV